MSPFIVESLFTNIDYPYKLMQETLQDMRLDPKYIPTMNDGMEAKTTAALENTLLAQLEQALAKGVVDESALTQEMNDLKWSAKAQAIVLKRAALVRSIGLVDTAVKEYAPEVVSGYATPEQMRAALEAAGAQPWYVDLQVSLAQSKAAVRETLKAEAEAKKDATTQLNTRVRDAVTEYVKDSFTLAELTAAVTAARTEYLAALAPAGVSLEYLAAEVANSAGWIASVVVDAQTRAQFGHQFVYGRTLTHEQGTLLKAQVAALLKQFQDALLTVDQLNEALAKLGIPPVYVEALTAKAAATSIVAHKGTSLQPI